MINERHLRRLLRRYLAYYNATRPHQSLHNQSPIRAQYNRERTSTSSRFRKSAAFTTAISAPPEYRGIQQWPRRDARELMVVLCLFAARRSS